MNYRNLAFVESQFGKDYKIANSGTGELTYHCPFCPGLGKRNNDRKLYVNVNKLVYNCMRCGSKGSLAGKDYGFYATPSEFTLSQEGQEEKTGLFRIPATLLADCPECRGYQYMRERGFSDDDIRFYSMRLPGLKESSLLGRVVIPNRIAYDNFTDMYTARTFVGHPNRYKNPSNSKKSSILFNAHNIKKGSEYIILNEGPLNSIIAGRQSVASFGKVLSDDQLLILKDLAPKNIYVSYDRDADECSEKVCKRITEITDIIPHRVLLPDGKDAVDLGREAYLEIVLNTPAYNRHSVIDCILSAIPKNFCVSH